MKLHVLLSLLVVFSAQVFGFEEKCYEYRKDLIPDVVTIPEPSPLGLKLDPFFSFNASNSDQRIAGLSSLDIYMLVRNNTGNSMGQVTVDFRLKSATITGKYRIEGYYDSAVLYEDKSIPSGNFSGEGNFTGEIKNLLIKGSSNVSIDKERLNMDTLRLEITFDKLDVIYHGLKIDGKDVNWDILNAKNKEIFRKAWHPFGDDLTELLKIYLNKISSNVPPPGTEAEKYWISVPKEKCDLSNGPNGSSYGAYSSLLVTASAVLLAAFASTK